MFAQQEARFDAHLRKLLENDPEATSVCLKDTWDHKTRSNHGVKVSDEQAGRLADALRDNTFVNYIDINFDNEMSTPEGLVPITEFISKKDSNVRRLGIQGASKENRTLLTHMFQMFLDAACANGKIQELVVDGQFDTNSLVNCLHGLRSKLKSFSLIALAKDIHDFAMATPTLPGLEKLSMLIQEEEMTSISTLLNQLAGEDKQGLKNLKELSISLAHTFDAGPGAFYSDDPPLGTPCDSICKVLASAKSLEFFDLDIPSTNPVNRNMEKHLKKVWNAIKNHQSLRDLRISYGTPELILTLLKSYEGESLEVTLPHFFIEDEWVGEVSKWCQELSEVVRQKQFHLKKLHSVCWDGRGFHGAAKLLPVEFIDSFWTNTSLTHVHIEWIHMLFDHDISSSQGGATHRENEHNDVDQELVNDGFQEPADVIGGVSLEEGKRAIKCFCLRNKFLPRLEAAEFMPEFLTLLVEMQSYAGQDQQYEEEDVLSSIYGALRLCGTWKELVEAREVSEERGWCSATWTNIAFCCTKGNKNK